MPEHARPTAVAPPTAVVPCPLPVCLVCAAGAVRPRSLTVAEWLAERLRPARQRARQRRLDRVARLRAGGPPVTTGPWPYSSWWDEG